MKTFHFELYTDLLHRFRLVFLHDLIPYKQLTYEIIYPCFIYALHLCF